MRVSAEELEATSVGLGALLTRDTRDNQFSTYSGSFFEVDSLFNLRYLGSDFSYQTLEMDYRKFIPVHDKVVVAGNARGCVQGGTVPFYDLCRLTLRGLTATQFMDEAMAMARAEVRWRARSRWTLVAFGGAGTVAEDVGDIDFTEFTYSVGAGIRFAVSKKRRINLRLDFAHTEFDNTVLLSVGEAF